MPRPARSGVEVPGVNRSGDSQPGIEIPGYRRTFPTGLQESFLLQSPVGTTAGSPGFQSRAVGAAFKPCSTATRSILENFESVSGYTAPTGIDPAPLIQARRSQTSRQAAAARIDRAPLLRAGRGRGSGGARRGTTTTGIQPTPLLRQSPRHVAPEPQERFRYRVGNPGGSLRSRPVPRGEGGHREEQSEGRGEAGFREGRREGETSHDISPWRGAVRDGLHGRAGTSSGKIVPVFGSEEST
jgi:hypothetical protein